MDYRVEYEGEVTIVSIGHAHEPIMVNGQATMYRVADGEGSIDACIRMAMRALYACQIVECEEDATSTDCLVWDEVEYEPAVRRERREIRVVGAWYPGEPAQYAVRNATSGAIIWDGEAYGPSDALERMARNAGYRDFETCSEDVGADVSRLIVEVAS